MTAQPNSMLPLPPVPQRLRELGIYDNETRHITTDEVWWRIHKTSGHHVLPWNTMRTYGPVLRFDPHALPVGDDPTGRAVWYGASTPEIALAEVFQIDRTIDRTHDGPYLTGISFTRQLTVLDVTTDSAGAWATRVGGNYALSTGPHAATQHWARHITDAFPTLDGIRYNSRFAGGPCVALFGPSHTAMPTRPILSLPLTHPGLSQRITGAAKRLGYLVI